MADASIPSRIQSPLSTPAAGTPLALDSQTKALTVDSLDLHPLPSWILRSGGCRIEHANRAALRLMSESRWIVHQANRLVAFGSLDAGELERLLRAAQLGVGQRHLVACQAKRKSPIELATLHLLSLRGWPLYGAAWTQADSLIIFERAPRHDNLAGWIGCHVSPRYGLTDTETKVLELFSQFLSAKEIATRLWELRRNRPGSFQKRETKNGQPNPLRLTLPCLRKPLGANTAPTALR